MEHYALLISHGLGRNIRHCKKTVKLQKKCVTLCHSKKKGKELRATQLGTACLIEATLADVTNPFHCVMITVVQLRLKDFKITNFQTRTSKRNLKVH